MMSKKNGLKILPIAMIMIFMLAVPCILTAANDPPCSAEGGVPVIQSTKGPAVILNVLITNFENTGLAYTATGSVTCQGKTVSEWSFETFGQFLLAYNLGPFNEVTADDLLGLLVSWADLFDDGFGAETCNFDGGDFVFARVPSFESGIDDSEYEFIEFRAVLLPAEVNCQ